MKWLNSSITDAQCAQRRPINNQSGPWCRGLSTINTQISCEAIRDLHTTIKGKHPCMLTTGVITLNNNAHHNVAHTVQDTLYSMLWKVLDHLSYNPDMSLCDFHVFGYPQKNVNRIQISFQWKSQGHGSTVVPVAAQDFLAAGSISWCLRGKPVPWHPWAPF